MDETKLAGSLRAIFIDLEDGWPIELLANHKDLTIKNFLMNLPGRDDVEVVTMDMCDRYRDIVKAVMPQAAVVVDRWHVVRTAVESMRQARIAYQQTLEKEERKELQRCLRSEEHTSELQSLMSISYAVLCLKKKQKTIR